MGGCGLGGACGHSKHLSCHIKGKKKASEGRGTQMKGPGRTNSAYRLDVVQLVIIVKEEGEVLVRDIDGRVSSVLLVFLLRVPTAREGILVDLHREQECIVKRRECSTLYNSVTAVVRVLDLLLLVVYVRNVLVVVVKGHELVQQRERHGATLLKR